MNKRLKIKDIEDGLHSKPQAFRSALLLLLNDLVARLRPPWVQCPLAVDVRMMRTPGWQGRKCGKCGYKSNLYDGKAGNGLEMFHCRRHPGTRITVATSACPDWEG